MIRKIISLLLVFTLTTIIVGASVVDMYATPTVGDVDPTGLDLNSGGSDSDTEGGPLAIGERIGSFQTDMQHWIGMMLLRAFFANLIF